MVVIANILSIISIALILSIHTEANTRVIGGRDAVRRQVPFIASIRNWGTANHIAGGALIGDRWVLTCASILQNRAGNSLEIFLGIIQLSGSTPSGTISRRSSSVTPHPGFSATSMANDIGLIELGGVGGVSYNDFVHPIFMESTRNDNPVTSMVKFVTFYIIFVLSFFLFFY